MINAVAAIAAPGWERVASLPVPNGGFLAGALEGGIMVAGGVTWRNDTKIWLDHIWTYHPKTNTWREAGRLPDPAAYPASGYYNRAWWFAGGSSETETHRALWRIGAGVSLERVATLDRGFVNTASALLNSTLYVVGGTDDQARLDRLTNAFLSIDLNTGAITSLAAYPEANLTTATAAALGNRIFVFGGARWDDTARTVVNHASAHAYSISEKRWEALPGLPFAVRGLTAAVLDDRHIFIAGGYRNDEVEFVADAFIFNVRTNTYSPTLPLPYAAMVHLVRSGDWLYCLGGEDRKRDRTDAVFRIRWQELLVPARQTP